jgi:hypothetical protein
MYPVLGAYQYGREKWTVANWTIQGQFDTTEGGGASDLIEVKPRIQREFWVNVYDNPSIYTSKRAADCDAACYPGRLACIKVVINCEPGEGL